MGEDELRKELAYYKRHLDEMAALQILWERQGWALRRQLRQKNQGFQLLSKLARSLGTQADLQSLLHVTALEINSELAMDRTIVFTPAEGGSRYAPTVLVGFGDEEAERLSHVRLELPPELGSGSGVVLASQSAVQTSTTERLRSLCGLATFVLVPFSGPEFPIALFLSGRLREDATFFPPLDQGDVDTFHALVRVLEAAIQDARLVRLEQTHRLKTELFANVSHELRTPLTLIIGPLAQILEGRWGQLPDPVRDRLHVVQRNQARLLELVNEILDLAQLEAGAINPRAAPLADFNELVKEAVGYFRLAAEARGIELRLALDPSLVGAPLHADREKLERLLFNLLSNALKFTEGGFIEVATRLVAGSVELVVTDTGIGMAPDEMPMVFARFGRASTARRNRLPGTGIGLAVVQEIAKQHGGSVRVESQRGKGSRFAVTVPLGDAYLHPGRNQQGAPPSSRRRRVEEQAPEQLAPPVDLAAVQVLNRSAEESFDPSKPIVLYVEDDADLIEHVRHVLDQEYNVFVAGDGVEGLLAARKYLPDAIVADRMMPRMDGRELLHALRGDLELQRIPVVFLTARYGTDGRIESLEAGADDYITKPFVDAELRARVRNLIHARLHERQLAELNRRLEMRIREQMAELVRSGEIKRFLPAAVVETLTRGALEKRPSFESRNVTLLVADVVGMPSIGQRPAAEVLSRMINEYLDAVASIATSRGGTIDSLAGARASILFGAPEAGAEHEAALSAVQVAIEIRAKLSELAAGARRRGVANDLRSRIGIDSGMCLVGAFGGESLRAYTAVGATANQAASLQAAAEPGQILCSASVHRLLDNVVRMRGLGRRIGTADPAYELLSVLCAREPQASSAPPPARAEAPVGAARVFRREGDYWTVRCDGSVFRLRDAKGVRYLAQLLARPGEEIHVLELVGSYVDEADAGPLLDGEAKSAYRERLRELDQDLQVARGCDDMASVARFEEERAMLVRELSAAVGLGGRDRKSLATVERARVNVTRAIKTVIERIATSNAKLARHCEATIRTGMFCSYRPGSEAPDSWDVAPG